MNPLKKGTLAVLVVAAGLIVTAACRGGATTGGTVSVPVVTPTTAPEQCYNSQYPSSAPQFGNDSSIKYNTTKSGLGIYDETVGTGTAATATSTVTVQYTGWLASGCVFNSTYMPGIGPVQLQLTQLIDGMKEGISTMKVGGERRIKIPAALAYGSQGVSGHIPPNSTIIFDVKLLGVGASSTASSSGSATSTCLNASYPKSAPQFGNDASIAYQTTTSGLGIYDETVGTGTALTASSTVNVLYTGWLSSGCVFDSTYLPGKSAATFPLSNLIPGMRDGISTMKVGGERRIKIPPTLGYGSQGISGVIPPNSTLIFDVKVLSASSTSP